MGPAVGREERGEEARPTFSISQRTVQDCRFFDGIPNAIAPLAVRKESRAGNCLSAGFLPKNLHSMRDMKSKFTFPLVGILSLAAAAWAQESSRTR